MNEGQNNNNNQNNNDYNIYNSMSADAFNVFNRNVATTTEAAQQAVPVQPVAQPQPTAPTPAPAPSTENLVTVNDYVEPKEPFSLKNLLKKKAEEEEKKIDINDISSFVTPKKSEEEIAEENEEKKKKKDLLVLIILIVVLIVMGYFAFTVFSNYLEPSSNGITTSIVKNEEVKEEKKTTNVAYNCDKPFDNDFYKIPYAEYINLESYKGKNNYKFKNDSLINIEESFTFTYNNELPEEAKPIITKYCNSYNAVYNAYKLLCTYSNNTIIIINIFRINKLETNVITNKVVTFNLIYNKDTSSAKLLENDKTCKAN